MSISDKVKNLDYKLKGLKAIRLDSLLKNYADILVAEYKQQAVEKTKDGVESISPDLFKKISETKEGQKLIADYQTKIQQLNKKSKETQEAKLKQKYTQQLKTLESEMTYKMMTLPGIFDSVLGKIDSSEVLKNVEKDKKINGLKIDILTEFLNKNEEVSIDDLGLLEMDYIIKELYKEPENNYTSLQELFTSTPDLK